MEKVVTNRSVAKRLSPRIAALLASRPQDVCFQCRYRTASAIQSRQAPLISPVISRRHASDSVKDKVLKRLWGRRSKDSPDETNQRSSGEETKQESHGNEREREASFEFGEQDTGAGYVEALTIDGLRTVGEITPEIRAKRLGLHDGYRGYMNQEQLKGSAIDGAVRQALVEVYTLREAGLPPAVSLNLDDDRGLVATKSARILRGPMGTPQIEWSDNDLRSALVQALTTSYSEAETSEASMEDTLDVNALEEDTAVAEHILSSKDAYLDRGSAQKPSNISEARFQDVSRSLEDGNRTFKHDGMSQSRNEAEAVLPGESFSEIWKAASEGSVETQALKSETSSPARLQEGNSWRKIYFDDEGTKFSILKRVMQLTGIRIPDPAIQKIDSVALLLAQLHEKPKPKKLAQTLIVNKQLKDLPNVQLMGRRYTPIDREQELGRWKVIVNELRERDLPIRGKKPPSEVEAEALAMPEGWEREKVLRQLEP